MPALLTITCLAQNAIAVTPTKSKSKKVTKTETTQAPVKADVKSKYPLLTADDMTEKLLNAKTMDAKIDAIKKLQKWTQENKELYEFYKEGGMEIKDAAGDKQKLDELSKYLSSEFHKDVSAMKEKEVQKVMKEVKTLQRNINDAKDALESKDAGK